MLVLLIFTAALIIAGILENARHLRNLSQISIRIHVNGTRGKSTTTRLIAGGLREAGLKVLAKTTGSAARIILPDGSEIPVKRWGRANIIEQIKIIALARKYGVDAVVIECMAITPEMQWVSEHRLIRSTIGVITNIRQDHSDQMGPTLADVANAVALTIPEQQSLVTAETAFLPLFSTLAERKGTIVYPVNPAEISDEEMQPFTYPTFKENVACALKVCELSGVPRTVALQGMWKAAPDIGAAKVWHLKNQGIYFVNGFAANDPASTRMVWEMWRNQERYADLQRLPVVDILNNRGDRGFRVKELAEFCGNASNMQQIILLGQMTHLARHFLKRAGVAPAKVSSYRPRFAAEPFLEYLKSDFAEGVVLFGFGNIKGAGQLLVEYCAKHGEEIR